MYSNAICNRRIREIFSSHPDIAVTHMSRLHWETVYQMLDSGHSIQATSIYHNMLVHKKNSVEELHLTVIEY